MVYIRGFERGSTVAVYMLYSSGEVPAPPLASPENTAGVLVFASLFSSRSLGLFLWAISVLHVLIAYHKRDTCPRIMNVCSEMERSKCARADVGFFFHCMSTSFN